MMVPAKLILTTLSYGWSWLAKARPCSVRRLRTPVLAYVGIVPTLPYVDSINSMSEIRT